MYYAVLADNLTMAAFISQTLQIRCAFYFGTCIDDGDSHGKACMDLVHAIDYLIDYRSHRLNA